MTFITLDRIKARCIEEGDCLIWQGALSKQGFPSMKFEGKSTTVRRVVMKLSGSPAASRQPVVCSCDEKKCVKLEHLKRSTIKKVSRKAVKTGYLSSLARRANVSATKRKSEKARLTIEKAREIRASDETGVALAKRYGVDETIIGRVRRGKLWIEYAATPFAGLGARV